MQGVLHVPHPDLVYQGAQQQHDFATIDAVLQESYLTGFFGFLGVSDIAFVRAEGVNLGAPNSERARSSLLWPKSPP